MSFVHTDFFFKQLDLLLPLWVHVVLILHLKVLLQMSLPAQTASSGSVFSGLLLVFLASFIFCGLKMWPRVLSEHTVYNLLNISMTFYHSTEEAIVFLLLVNEVGV